MLSGASPHGNALVDVAPGSVGTDPEVGAELGEWQFESGAMGDHEAILSRGNFPLLTLPGFLECSH
jgi:hypothetical protein